MINQADLSRVQKRSVQKQPQPEGGGNFFVLQIASVADQILPWGVNPAQRDWQLRNFITSKAEPMLAGALAAIAARNAAFSWSLEGPNRTCNAIQQMLHLSNYGGGWTQLILQVSTDLYTQDNGAFIELIRDGDSPTAPVIGLAHLDAGRCMRTGNLDIPVIYTDKDGGQHKMPWYTVLELADNPSPVEDMHGMQLCAVSRVLLYAQLIRNAMILGNEKLDGRFAGAIHVVSGVPQKAIDAALERDQEKADRENRTRYMMPTILGTLDPTATVDLKTIPLKSLPDNWDEETDRKWYTAILALALGCEYQDLAPLPGGNLGTSQQSPSRHLPAQGKGSGLFMKLMEHKLNFYVLPRNVSLKFDEKDLEAEQMEATVKKLRAEERAARITSGEITAQVARQIAEDDGDLRHEYLVLMTEQDATPETEVTDQEPADDEESEDEAVVEDQEPQASAQPAPAQQQPPGTKEEAEERAKLERIFGDDVEDVLTRLYQRVAARLKRDVSS